MTSVLLISEEGIGNGILRTPIARHLKERGVTVDCVASKRSLEVMSMCPNFRQVFLDGDETYKTYDFGIDCQFTSGVMVRKYKPICKKILRNSPPTFATKHELIHNLELLPEITGEDIDLSGDLWRRFPLSIEAPGEFYGMPRGWADNMVMVHTGCFDTHDWRNRFWTEENWSALSNLIWEKWKWGTVFVGAAGEKHRLDRIAKGCRRESTAFIVGESLRDIFIYMGEMVAFISIDSGIMHLAAARGLKQVALFGPTSEIKSMPWQDPSRIRIVRDEDLWCKRCYLEHKEEFKTCEEAKCMKWITPDRVLEAVKELLWKS